MDEMRVIEFKMSPHKEAIAAWEYQLKALKAVWNSALAIRIEADARYWIEKNGLKDICPGAVLKRKGNKKVSKKVDGETKIMPTQWRTVLSGVRRPTEDKLIIEGDQVVGAIAGPYCCVRKLQGVTPLDKSIKVGGKSVTCALSRTQAKSNYPWMDAKLVDSCYMSGVYRSLTVAWKEYKKTGSDRGRPKFKGEKDKLESLANISGEKKSTVKFLSNGGRYNGLVKFPMLAPIKVKGLYRRYHSDMAVGTVRVVKKADGWYLQVTVKNPVIKPVKVSTEMVGLDPGVKKNIATSQGKKYHCIQSERIEQRIRKLQRKASRQYLMNKKTEGHDHTQKEIESKCSNGHDRTQKEIARLKGIQKRSRKAWQHKTTTRIVSEFGLSAIEDTNVKNMTRKAKAKPNKEGGFDRNGAAAKSGLNRAILKSSIGGFKAMLESKSESAGRRFVKVPAAYTSATCNACGHQHTKAEKPKYRPNQSTFICQSCGHTDNADTNAAKNILDKGLEILQKQADEGLKKKVK